MYIEVDSKSCELILYKCAGHANICTKINQEWWVGNMTHIRKAFCYSIFENHKVVNNKMPWLQKSCLLHFLAYAVQKENDNIPVSQKSEAMKIYFQHTSDMTDDGVPNWSSSGHECMKLLSYNVNECGSPVRPVIMKQLRHTPEQYSRHARSIHDIRYWWNIHNSCLTGRGQMIISIIHGYGGHTVTGH